MDMAFRGSVRSAIAWMALLATALILLRPVCELWHAGGMAQAAGAHALSVAQGAPASMPDGSSARCCLLSAETGVAKTVQAVAFRADLDSGQPLPAFIPLLALAIAAFALPRPRLRRPVLRTPQSFYLRSTRILR